MTATAQRTLTLSCVILTMGNRPAEVIRAIDSVLAQHGTPVDLVVVGNGADVTGLPAGVRTVRLPENVGVAAGRNAGVAACEGDVVLFLDDDGWYPDAGLAVHIAGRFAADPSLAVLSMQVVDPDGGPGARWHVPRLRAGDPERSSVVTTFLGGACAIRRSAFLEAGGLPDLFFYGHEETDLAWQLMDRGYRLEYDATPGCVITICRTPGMTRSAARTGGTGSCWPGATCPGRWPRSTWPTGWCSPRPGSAAAGAACGPGSPASPRAGGSTPARAAPSPCAPPGEWPAPAAPP